MNLLFKQWKKTLVSTNPNFRADTKTQLNSIHHQKVKISYCLQIFYKREEISKARSNASFKAQQKVNFESFWLSENGGCKKNYLISCKN